MKHSKFVYSLFKLRYTDVGSVAVVVLLLLVAIVAVGSVITAYKWHNLHHKNQTTQGICRACSFDCRVKYSSHLLQSYMMSLGQYHRLHYSWNLKWNSVLLMEEDTGTN